MKLEYDKNADTAYLKLTDSQIVESEEVFPDIIYDFDEDNQIVGIEILKLKGKTPEQLKLLDFPFSAEDKTELKEFFSLYRYSF
jgi:uncharacterized protein YuzE